MIPKCTHGYFEHSEFNRCPWCHGWDKHNKDAIPINGIGNGWLLRKEQYPCISCGGPSGGWGRIAGNDTRSPEQRAKDDSKRPCYSCTMGLKND